MDWLFKWLGFSAGAVIGRVWNTITRRHDSILQDVSGAVWIFSAALVLLAAALPFEFLRHAAIVSLGWLWSVLLIDALAWGAVEVWNDGGDTTTKRGVEITTAKALGKGRKAPGQLRLGGVPVPHDAETLNFLMAGSPGSGKSQAINGNLDAIRARGERVMMADVGGEAMASWWQEGDQMLNVFDTRTQDWSPFAEMEGPWDAAMIAKSIVPDKDGSEKEWALFSQALIEAVLLRLWECQATSNEKFLYYLTIAKSTELQNLVHDLPAQTLFDTGAAKMLSSVRGIIGTALMPYRYLNPKAGKDGFSVRKWVKEGEGWLWIPYRADMQDTLAPLIACWTGVLSTTVLSLKSELGRRIWLVMDEFAALGRIQGIQAAFDKGRKKGLCIIIGLQTVAQARLSYGPQGAQIIMSCIANKLILRTEDHETAKYLSDTLGEREIVRTETSSSRNDSGSSESSARRHTSERVVIPSQIQNLPALTGYLKLAGYPIAQVEIPIVHKPEVIEPFVQKPFGRPETKAEAPAEPEPQAQPETAAKIDLEELS